MLKLGIPSIVLICFWYFGHPVPLFSQSIETNAHVKYDVRIVDNHYAISYTFKDHFNNFQTYDIFIPVDETQRMINKFGIPLWMFEPYADNEQNHQYREKEMAGGLFLLNSNVIEVDKSAILSYYSETFARPIAKMIVSSLDDYGVDNRRNRIEFAMRFIQDIPYGTPINNDGERHFGGVYIPPQLLIKGYGDCDSKVLLFVGILTYLIPAEDIVFLNQTEHVLSAVIEEPDKGLTFVKYNGSEYLIAETSGPGKRQLGQKGSYFSERFSIEPLDIDLPDVIPWSDNSEHNVVPVHLTHVEENILILRNESSRGFQFQISPDNRRWETLNLEANHAGRYIFDQKVKMYLRFRSTTREKFTTYRVGSGNTYSILWNRRRKRWEISI